MAGKVYFSVNCHGVELVLRDAEATDADFLIKYIHDSDLSFLRRIGFDPDKRRSRQEMREAWDRQSLADKKDSPNWRFILATKERPIGALNVVSIKRGDSAECHAHIFAQEDRSHGFAKAILPLALQTVFTEFDLQQIVLKPIADNAAINGLLRTFGLAPIATVDEPAGAITLPRIANVYIILRAQADALVSALK